MRTEEVLIESSVMCDDNDHFAHELFETNEPFEFGIQCLSIDYVNWHHCFLLLFQLFS